MRSSRFLKQTEKLAIYKESALFDRHAREPDGQRYLPRGALVMPMMDRFDPRQFAEHGRQTIGKDLCRPSD
jgi:hypothetical protein